MTPALLYVAVAVFVPLAFETRLARNHEQIQRARGGREASGDVYALMAVAYPAAFVGMLAEGALGGGPGPAVFAFGATLFAAAKVLKYWAIASLGQAWTFRVIVVPGATLVTAGPYRFLRHPNYVAVIGELAGVGLMTGASAVGPVAVALFGLLIFRRIAVEERALGRVDH